MERTRELFEMVMKDDKFKPLKKAFATFALVSQPLSAFAEEGSKIVESAVADASSNEANPMRMAFNNFTGGKVSYSKFKEMLDNHLIKQVVFEDDGSAKFALFNNKIGQVQIPANNLDLLEELKKSGVDLAIKHADPNAG